MREPDWNALREELLAQERTLNETVTVTNQFAAIGDQHCDFCNALNPSPRKTYACQSFRVAAIVDGSTDPPVELLGSSGSWLACQPCAALIDAKKIDELTDRALVGNTSAAEITDPGERMFLLRFLKGQFEQFMRLKARTQ